MGLDINLVADNDENLITPDYFSNEELYNSHQLSRTFCNFMCRRDVCDGVAELDQIGQLTGIDIAPLYDMQSYFEDYQMEEELEYLETEEEKNQYLRSVEESRELLKNNIDAILNLITNLIDALGKMDDLNQKLDHGGYDTLGNDYFSDFNTANDQSYIHNNFGQDLRNFKRFLDYAKANGSTSVAFIFG